MAIFRMKAEFEFIKKSFVLFGALGFLPIACSDTDKENKKPAYQKSVYLDYKISGAEETGRVTCLFRFLSGSMQGRAVTLQEPGKVELDGEVLSADSTPIAGAYYEKIFPLEDFYGSHTIVFTDEHHKQHQETFRFSSFTIPPLPQKIQRRPFTLTVKSEHAVPATFRLVMMDTSFVTDDVNELVRPAGGAINIQEKMLGRLKNGPVFLELSSEEERSLQEAGKSIGRLSVSYHLKRNFMLTGENIK